MSQETVLITGASSGIGWGLAKLFAADGSRLVLVARREEKLRELADELKAAHGTETVIIPLDLGELDAPRQLMDRLQQDNIPVDVLINNAGFGQYGRFEEIPPERHVSMVQVNITALMQLTHLVLPQMVARGSGSVLNVGSTASFQPGPNAAVYFATKAFVLSFSEAIWEEMREKNVWITALCPGPTKTNFGDDSLMDKTRIFRWNSMHVDAVAKAGYDGIRKRKRLVVPGIVNNLLAGSVRISPRRFILRTMRFLQPDGIE